MSTTPATVTSSTLRRPEWDAVRETTAAITHHGRLYLRGQVRLGMLLAGLKKAHGITHGGNRKSSAAVPHLIPWKEIVFQETGFSRQTGDEFIRLYESVVAKLKRTKYLAEIPGPASDALVLFQPENALALTPEQWGMVDQIISTLTTGETQSTLLTELGVVAKPRPMPTPHGSTATRELTEQETAGQLAFHFFEGVTASLVNTRCNPDYLMLLHALPLTSTAKPTKGRVLAS